MHTVPHINTARIAWSLLRFIAVVENVLTCIHDYSAHPIPMPFYTVVVRLLWNPFVSHVRANLPMYRIYILNPPNLYCVLTVCLNCLWFLNFVMWVSNKNNNKKKAQLCGFCSSVLFVVEISAATNLQTRLWRNSGCFETPKIQRCPCLHSNSWICMWAQKYLWFLLSLLFPLYCLSLHPRTLRALHCMYTARKRGKFS